MWDLPELGTEPMSPALAGGFFTTELPGKPGTAGLFYFILFYFIRTYLISMKEISLNFIF